MVLYILLILGSLLENLEGFVNLTPANGQPHTQVCSGEQIVITCTTNETTLVWNINTTNDNGISMPVVGNWYISSSDLTEQIQQLTVNSDIFTVRRTSPQNGMPLVSTLSSNNGISMMNNLTKFICTELRQGLRRTSLASTIHLTSNRQTDNPVSADVNVRPGSIEYGTTDVSVILQWSPEEEVSFNVTAVPKEILLSSYDDASVQIMLLYNTEYYVSVTATQCGNKGITTLRLSYAKCEYPLLSSDGDSNVTVLGYRDPSIEGDSIIFRCLSPNQKLVGSDEATCNSNGQWQPSPSMVKCEVVSHCANLSPLSVGFINPYTSTVKGTVATFSCINISSKKELPTSLELHATICSSDGKWRPNPSEFCSRRIYKLSNDDLTKVVASSLSAYLLSSCFFFILGYLYRHCLHHKCWRWSKTNHCEAELTIPPSHSLHIPVYEDVQPDIAQTRQQVLELNENVAYACHPRKEN